MEILEKNLETVTVRGLDGKPLILFPFRKECLDTFRGVLTSIEVQENVGQLLYHFKGFQSGSKWRQYAEDLRCEWIYRALPFSLSIEPEVGNKYRLERYRLWLKTGGFYEYVVVTPIPEETWRQGQ